MILRTSNQTLPNYKNEQYQKSLVFHKNYLITRKLTVYKI